MTVAATSREAYKTVAVTENEAKVLAVFGPSDQLRDEDIAERLGWGIQSVTGRVQGLLKAGKLVACGRGKTSSGNACRITRLATGFDTAAARTEEPCPRCDAKASIAYSVKCAKCCRDWIFSIDESAHPSAIERIRLSGGPADRIAAYLERHKARAA